jgi:microcystin degradation protein MlrC
MRFALAGFVHETVTFLPSPTTRADFETIALRGQDLLDGHRGGNTVFGGFIAACDNADVDLIGLVASDHAPSGPVEQDAFDAFTREIIEGTVAIADSINGLLLHLHGAMATSLLQDPEREVLRRLRERLGPLPIGLALDLHGNLSVESCRLATVVCGFHHSPHTDMAATGQRTADLLIAAVRGEIVPVVAARKPGLVLPSVFTATAEEPLAGVMAAARAAETAPGILDVTVFTGFAYADVSCIGATVVVVADGDEIAAARTATELADLMSRQRAELYRPAELASVDSAVATASALVAEGRRPIAIVEHADRGNDSTYVLQKLLAERTPRSFIPYVTDPVAAIAARNAGVGGQVMLALGGNSSDLAGDPVLLGGTALFTGPKSYRATGPYRTGELIDLGLCAVIDTGAAIVIVISEPVVAVDQDPFNQFGFEIDDFDLILLRSKTHFRAAYGELAAHILIAETPDFGRADLTQLDYVNAPEDVYPFNR